ncbi:MAG TPA: efflux RND transporter periplasmic adaptor subunit [Bryobacteraceae bacterium]|nr:efflux RND transporter periplasmic adaptor subunit [Bryobacteraceae bacterium]
MKGNTEEQLRAEIEELKQRLAEQHPHHEHQHPHGHARRRPATGTLIAIGLLLLVVIVAAFFGGYLPHVKLQTELAAEAKSGSETAPRVNVTAAERSSSKSELILPGNIQAITEAPVLARATGYLKARFADIGDRVKEGQLLAEIDAPELGQQVTQAKASVDQGNAALEQANANLVQARTNEQLYKTTADRWSSLVQKGAVSKQENDTYQAQYRAQVAAAQALDKAVNVAKSNIGATEANLGRLTEMQGYVKVRAPFAGVITQRNVDVGALVNEGSTLLYRIAQTDRLRTYVNVPQSDSTAVHVGQAAKLSIADLPSKVFLGTVTRTANSLDPSSRTLLTEVQVPNAAGLLMPGMYAQVDFTTARAEPPLLIKGDALVVRSNGPQVAIVEPDKTVHFQIVTLGRDYGDKIEILSGLNAGDQLVVNPGDSIQEHARVSPVLLAAPKK